nr:hypothetical protein Iba_chr01bCG3360 [Ipomoea batatas]
MDFQMMQNKKYSKYSYLGLLKSSTIEIQERLPRCNVSRKEAGVTGHTIGDRLGSQEPPYPHRLLACCTTNEGDLQSKGNTGDLVLPFSGNRFHPSNHLRRRKNYT